MAQEMINELKALIASSIDLGGVDIGRFNGADPIFSKAGLGLDSLDAMDLLMLLQKQYGIVFKDMNQGREMFQNLETLAQYIEQHRTK